MSAHHSWPLELLFSRLWAGFTEINPQAESIHKLLKLRGETIINDHIAFRTFQDPRVGVEILEQPFIAAGYVVKGEYRFEKKKLMARHYEHSDADLPKIFISELKVHDFSSTLQRIVEDLLDQLLPDALEDPELCAAGRLWNISVKDYETLAAESEYAGWLGAFGFRANHFTVLVNSLQTVDGLAELNELIRGAGFPLNEEGGEIKGSPQELLEQSATLASHVMVKFSDGMLEIPGCYYEFAQRYPTGDGTLFSGFVTTSADKIFQSTDRR